MHVLETLRGASLLAWTLGIGLLVLNVLPFFLGGLAFRKRRLWRLVTIPIALSVLCAVTVVFDLGLFGGDASVEFWLPANVLFCTYALTVLKSPTA